MDRLHQLDFVARECGCEYGGDCTKTTVCAIDSALADQADRIRELEAQLEAVKGYALHLNWCDYWDAQAEPYPGKCNCGYEAAIGESE
jgi:hypothetical protein